MRTSPAPGRSIRGFTLLEVLVALTVLTISLGALIKVASEHARNTAYLQERTLAHWVAQNLMARYEAGLFAVQPGQAAGSLRQAEREWAYSVDIRDVLPQGEFEFQPVRRVEIAVWPALEPEEDVRARLVGYLMP